MNALNMQSYPIRPWALFADHLNYTKQYWACYFDGETPGQPHYNSSMIEIYQKLAGNLRNIVVFNGDTDPSVQMRGTEAAVNAMGFKTVQGADWRPWFFAPERAELGVLEEKLPYWGSFLNYRSLNAQLGGYVKNFEQNISFVTVHDSGHMVPQYKPIAAFHLFVQGLWNKPLSPPLNVSAVANATDAEFFGSSNTTGYMGDWVKEASSNSYTDNTKRHFRPNAAQIEERELPFEAHSISRKMLRSPNKENEKMVFSDMELGSKLRSLEKQELKSLMDELQELYETM